MKMRKSVIAAAVIAVTVVGILILAFACTAARVTPTAPATVETEDCDKEDQAKGEWWEGCTIAPKVTPAKPKPTPTKKRRP